MWLDNSILLEAYERIMYIRQRIYKSLSAVDLAGFPYDYFTGFFHYRQEKRKRRQTPPQLRVLLLAEGLAVGALVHGGVCFVGADHDAVQRAIVLVFAVVCTLGNGALDALVGIAVHIVDLLYLSSNVVWSFCRKI